MALDAAYDGFISYSHGVDGILAPRLQSGLQRFAKPWWKRRASRVFRDDASLSATPHLWSSIAEALDSSAWFIVLLSPEAAESTWVAREIEHWRAHRDPGRILPVLTDGDLDWNGTDLVGSAVPPALSGAFVEEPRWVDLRSAHGPGQLDLKHPGFAAAVADIASTIRGVPKDELQSEEVRQHRRTVRTAWSVGLVMVALTITTTIVAAWAIDQRREADRQATLAADRAADAREQADAARAAEADARANLDQARQQAAIVESRRLQSLAGATSDREPQLALLLLLEAYRTAPTPSVRRETIVELADVIVEDRLVAYIPWTDVDSHVGISPDGSVVFVSSPLTGTLSAIEVDSGSPRWVYRTGATGDRMQLVVVDPIGDWVAVAIGGSASRVDVLDATSGQLIAEVDAGDCPDLFFGHASRDGRWLTVNGGTDRCGLGPDDDWAVTFDADTWAESERYLAPGRWVETAEHLGTDRAVIRGNWDVPTLTAALAPPAGPIEVVEPNAAPREVVDDAHLWTASSDGRRIAYLTATDHPAIVVEVATGASTTLTPRTLDERSRDDFSFSFVTPLAFSPDGTRVSAISDQFGGVVFDARSGGQLITLGYDGPTWDQAWSGDGTRLVTMHDDAIRVWSMSEAPVTQSSILLSDDWVSLALDRVVRGFTPGECHQYRLDVCRSSVAAIRDLSDLDH